MRKPTFTALLTACLLTTAGIAVAEQSDQPKLNVQKTDDNRAVITVDQSQPQKQQMSSTVRNEQKSLRGTVVSLETYLKQGEQAARDEARSASRPGAPKALLAEDGQLYVILGMNHADRSAMNDHMSSPPRTGAAASADMQTDADDRLGQDADELRSSPGYELAEDTETRSTTAGATASTDMKTSGDTEDRLGQGADELRHSPGYEITNETDDRSASAAVTTDMSGDATTTARVDTDSEIKRNDTAAPGRERHTHKADMSARDERQSMDKDELAAATTTTTDGSDNRNDLTAPGRERHTDKADLGARNQDKQANASDDATMRTSSDMHRDTHMGATGSDARMSGATDTTPSTDGNVYGFADPSQQQLRIGDKVNVTGQVYERSGLRAIEISKVQPSQS